MQESILGKIAEAIIRMYLTIPRTGRPVAQRWSLQQTWAPKTLNVNAAVAEQVASVGVIRMQTSYA